MITQKGNKIIVKADAPKRFKYEVTQLLNQLMKDYNIKGKDKDFEDTFKSIFKSNLYYIIDNYFNVNAKARTQANPKKDLSLNNDFKAQEKPSPKVCPHCNMDINIRNPSGYCDHLYYPDYCDVCTKREAEKKMKPSRVMPMETIDTLNRRKKPELISMYMWLQERLIKLQKDFDRMMR